MPTESSLPSRTPAVIVAAACAAALALRTYALGYGLPDVHNPDEIPILNTALSFAKGDPSPHRFLYPSLYFYALFVWEGLFFVAARGAGLYHSVAEFQRAFFLDPSRVVLAGRALTALFGVLTVLAVYRFGARLFDRWTGAIAAVLLAVTPFAVRDAHYIKQDVPVTLFVVLAQVCAARLITDPAAADRRSTWLTAGGAAGLALSTHYYAFPVVLPIVAAAVIHGRRTGEWLRVFRLLAASGLASIAAFVATTPFLIIEWRTASRDMGAVWGLDVERRATAAPGHFSALATYLRMLVTDATGWGPIAVLAIIGFVQAIGHDWRRGLALVVFPAAFLAFLATTVPMNRYVNAMLPSLALAAAFAITHHPERRKRRSAFAIAALTILSAGPALAFSLRSDAFFDQADTRSLAREFVERTVPAGSSVIVQPHQVQLHPSYDALVEALRTNLGSEASASVKFQGELAAARAWSPAYRVLYLGTVTDGGLAPDKIYVAPQAFDQAGTLAPLRAIGVAYVVINRYNTQNSAFGSLYAALQREAHLLATFSPYRANAGPERRAAVAPFFHNTSDRIDSALERPGPPVEIWHID